MSVEEFLGAFYSWLGHLTQLMKRRTVLAACDKSKYDYMTQ